MEQPILKYRPDEFIVAEAISLSKQCMNNRNPKFRYFRLVKAGFTTFEAVAEIAEFLSVATSRIHYAGLKDEDAITEQFIALDDAAPDQNALQRFNAGHRFGHYRFLELHQHGAGDEQIRVGNLNGNTFRLVVRNLSRDILERLFPSSRTCAYFLNYYDTQRFGVATGPKITHLIGKALLVGNFDAALACLKRAGTPESGKAIGFNGTAEEFFQQLEPRVVAFFKSSHVSYTWNERLAALVRSVCGKEAMDESAEAIPFVFARRQSLVTAVAREQMTLEYQKFYGSDGGGCRATTVQVQLLCHSVAEDDVNENAYKCDVSFFLPSGCYATMFAKQFFNMTDVHPS